MTPTALRRMALNLGHHVDHLAMLIFATAVIGMAPEFGLSYGEMIAYGTPAFVLFGAMSLPFGWLGDRWSRNGLMIVFFFGIGASLIVTGMAASPLGVGIGLSMIGLFAAIYHPVGIASLVQGSERVGWTLGVNGVWGNLGVAAAPLLTGWLMAAYGWRTAFIAPGIAIILIGFAFAAFVASGQCQAPTGPKARREPVDFLVGWQRVLLVLVFVTLFGGLIFNSTTISLPKLFDERLDGVADSLQGFTLMASLVYAAASVAQIGAGLAIDRWNAKPILLGVVAAQAIMMPIVATSQGWLLFAASFAMMLAIFAQIPIADMLITRYVPDRLRSRVFSVKYVLNLGVGSMAVPAIALFHLEWGGFRPLFLTLGIIALLVTTAALFLPGRRIVQASAVPAE